MLKYHYFRNKEELVMFVNENKITKENIQSIVTVDVNKFVLFYWLPACPTSEPPILNG